MIFYPFFKESSECLRCYDLIVLIDTVRTIYMNEFCTKKYGVLSIFMPIHRFPESKRI